MKLRDAVLGVAHKRLTRVDISGQRKPGHGSNQHEINAGPPIRELLSSFVAGERSDRIDISWIRLDDDEAPRIRPGTVRLYDARAGNSHRSAEWRLHYDGDPLEGLVPGDIAVLVLTVDRRLHGLLVANGSEWHDELDRTFGIAFERGVLTDDATSRAHALPDVALVAQSLGPRQALLFDELGIDLDGAGTPNADIELVVERFGEGDLWPSAKDMVAFAQLHAETSDDPDEQLVAWLVREHELFRALERVRTSERIKAGFVDGDGRVDVDEFIRVSLSMHQRRKARMGLSLEGHLATLFRRERLEFDEQKATEGRRTPDFLFPGHAAYLAAEPGDPSLFMLGAKSTCKDRWRQILNEAAKIPTKHLCTLEPAISTAQLDEMQEERVVLVVPARDHPSFAAQDQRRIWSVAQFIETVAATQAAN